MNGERPTPIRYGRWGVEQFTPEGKSVGSCLIWCGYETEADAIAANPPSPFGHTFRPFDRFIPTP